LQSACEMLSWVQGMSSETKSLCLVLATIALMVASSFAAMGYLANEASVSRAKGALTQAPDVADIRSRAALLLGLSILLWLGAGGCFAGSLPTPPSSPYKRYAISAVITGLGIAATVTILSLTMMAIRFM